MARSPITASKEGEATLAAEETLHFDDDNLRGEEQHAVCSSCWQRITFAPLTPAAIYFSRCEGNNIEFKPFYSVFVKDMLTMSFNFISAVAEVKLGRIKAKKIDHFHFSFFFFKFIPGSDWLLRLLSYSGEAARSGGGSPSEEKIRVLSPSQSLLLFTINLRNFTISLTARGEEGRPLAVYCGERNWPFI